MLLLRRGGRPTTTLVVPVALVALDVVVPVLVDVVELLEVELLAEVPVPVVEVPLLAVVLPVVVPTKRSRPFTE